MLNGPRQVSTEGCNRRVREAGAGFRSHLDGTKERRWAMTGIMERGPQRAAHSSRDRKVRLKRLLVVLEGSELSDRVLKYVISHSVNGTPLEAVLLYVQPQIVLRAPLGYPNHELQVDYDGSCDNSATSILAAAAKRLGQVGIMSRGRIETGDPGEVILRSVIAEQCDQIVLGDPAQSFSIRASKRGTSTAVGYVLKQATRRGVTIPLTIIQ